MAGVVAWRRSLRARLVLGAACVAAIGIATAGAPYSRPLLRRVAFARRNLSPALSVADPFLDGQWYLSAVHAFDFWPSPAPSFTPVRVAVLDTGVDGTNPDVQGVVAAARSFVGGSALTDELGHGTMVAGEILAAAGDRIDGKTVSSPIELLVGKIVASDGTIAVDAEAHAIRWAVDEGARVINMSVGAQRDPLRPNLDQYSAVENAAVQFAYRHGVLVVAPTGNCADACPYNFASYPAALEHVLAVSAFAPNGTTPGFSNRDARRNDLSAPGIGIVSTFPLDLTQPGCSEPVYSVCATDPTTAAEMARLLLHRWRRLQPHSCSHWRRSSHRVKQSRSSSAPPTLALERLMTPRAAMGAWILHGPWSLWPGHYRRRTPRPESMPAQPSTASAA